MKTLICKKGYRLQVGFGKYFQMKLLREQFCFTTCTCNLFWGEKIIIEF